jgi:hypothetical protein
MIRYLPYLPRITTVDFFPLSESEVRAGRPLTVPEQLQDKLEGVIRTIAIDEFANAFRRWMDQCKKYVCFGGN